MLGIQMGLESFTTHSKTFYCMVVVLALQLHQVQIYNHLASSPGYTAQHFFALWKNTGREPRLLGASHDVTYVT